MSPEALWSEMRAHNRQHIRDVCESLGEAVEDWHIIPSVKADVTRLAVVRRFGRLRASAASEAEAIRQIANDFAMSRDTVRSIVRRHIPKRKRLRLAA